MQHVRQVCMQGHASVPRGFLSIQNLLHSHRAANMSRGMSLAQLWVMWAVHQIRQSVTTSKYLGSGLSHGLSSSLAGFLTQLHTGHLACQLVQVVLCVVQEAIDDLIALAGTLRPLLLGQQLLIGLPVMCLPATRGAVSHTTCVLSIPLMPAALLCSMQQLLVIMQLSLIKYRVVHSQETHIPCCEVECTHILQHKQLQNA